jgi:hypothetical protein
MRVLAVDPGVAVGIAWLDSERHGSFRSFERDRWAATSYVAHLCDEDGVDLVVCESFIPRPGVRTWQPDALEMIGALRFVARRAGVAFETQSPAEAKRFSTNDKLKLLGWRSPTRGGHADDAARHLLLAAVRHGLIDAARFAG